MRRFGLLLSIVIAVLVALGGTAHAGGRDCDRGHRHRHEVVCQEDEQCWNCETMGNHICGTTTSTSEVVRTTTTTAPVATTSTVPSDTSTTVAVTTPTTEVVDTTTTVGGIITDTTTSSTQVAGTTIVVGPPTTAVLDVPPVLPKTGTGTVTLLAIAFIVICTGLAFVWGTSDRRRRRRF